MHWPRHYRMLAARYARGAMVAVALLACASQSGCVTRRLTILSDPPGATVYVDDEEVGTTPCSVAYIYYGTREIVLVKDGFETRTVLQEFPTPVYEYFPLEFVTENLIPWEIRDERTVEFKLQPRVQVPVEQIRERGQQLRGTVQGQFIPGVVPGLAPAAPLLVPTPPPGNLPAPPRIKLGTQPAPLPR